MKKELITNVDPKSPVSEVFRSLRTNIQYMAKSSKSQTIVFTSTAQGEGKSWVAANLAIAFAQAEKNVVIIDADMRRPRQHNIFNIDLYPGLSNYLSGITSRGYQEEIDIKNCIQATEVDNLYIIPAGNIPPNPSELLASQKTRDLVEELKNIFDIIIFDGAPCLLVTDATVLSRIADSTILVSSYKQTKIDDLKEAKRRIESIGGHVAGVVLNRVNMSSKKYENKYYYYTSSNKKAIGSHEKISKYEEKSSKQNEEDDEIDETKKIMEEIKEYNKSIKSKQKAKPKTKVKNNEKHSKDNED